MAEHDRWDTAYPDNRERTRQSQIEVRALLMRWDPIGVSGIPEAADEYDCMISPLMHRLYEGASTSTLAAWIASERTEHFGLQSDSTADHALADELVEWWSARRSGYRSTHRAAGAVTSPDAT